MPCEHFCLKKNEIKDYWSHILKNYTSSVDMDEMVDHWLDSFEKFPQEVYHYAFTIVKFIAC